jgi:hypothetical protein
MPTVITGTDGINQVQAGAVESGDLPSGSVLQVQVVQTTNIFSQSFSVNTTTIIDEFDLNITPHRSNSTILLQVSSHLEFNADNDIHDHIFTFFRGSTKLGHPPAGIRNVGIAMATRTFSAADADSTPEHLSFHFTDQPTVVFFNRSVGDADADNHERGVSTITAIEIAG